MTAAADLQAFDVVDNWCLRLHVEVKQDSADPAVRLSVLETELTPL